LSVPAAAAAAAAATLGLCAARVPDDPTARARRSIARTRRHLTTRPDYAGEAFLTIFFRAEFMDAPAPPCKRRLMIGVGEAAPTEVGK